MEVIAQLLATVCSTVFGTFFMFYIIALAFDVMTGNKSQSMSRGVMSFSLKLIGAVAKGLIMLSIPIFRTLGEKLLYVASHYTSKNKYNPSKLPSQNQKPMINAQPDYAGYSDPAPLPAQAAASSYTDLPATDPQPSKKKSDNPYECPAEPEFIE